MDVVKRVGLACKHIAGFCNACVLAWHGWLKTFRECGEVEITHCVVLLVMLHTEVKQELVAPSGESNVKL